MGALAAGLILLLPLAARTAPEKTSAPAPVSISTVNVNTAGEEELRTLPGIGREEARKIIAGRPYSAPEGFFRRAGIAPRDREALLSRVRFGDAHPPASGGRPITFEGGHPATEPTPPPPSARVDVNTATLRELSAVHGLAPYAPRIVKFRPYRSLGELSRAGVPREIVLQSAKFLRVGPGAGDK